MCHNLDRRDNDSRLGKKASASSDGGRIEEEDLKNIETEKMIEADQDEGYEQLRENESATVEVYGEREVEGDLVGDERKNKETEKVESNLN